MDIWESVWEQRYVISDYSLKLYSFLNDISNTLEKKSKVLEVGCGSGEGLATFKGHDIYGIDISKKAINLTKRFTKKVFQVDAANLEFKDNFFDLVFSSGLIEHFDNKKIGKIIKEMSRVSKKNGKILVIVPNSCCLWYKVYKFLQKKFGAWDFGFERDFTYFQLKRILEKNGIEVKKSFGLQIFPPLATNKKELLSQKMRKYLILFEKPFPLKKFYSYAIGIMGEKRSL